MKKILFPTDFSKNAENALRYALEFALKMDAKVFILNVNPLPYDFVIRVEEAIDSLEKYSDKKLRKLVDEIKDERKYKNLTIESKTSAGSIVLAILETAERLNVDLIVMGTKGASGLDRFFFGSNTAEIIRRANVPVLVVPKDAAYQKFGKMIYAIDYREDDLYFLQELSKLAEILDTNIETIHVAPKNSLQEQILHKGLVQLVDEKVSKIFTEHHLVINASVTKGIEEYLNNNPNCLLAMAHYKRTFLQSLLNNSFTEEMAYRTKTPLFIFN